MSLYEDHTIGHTACHPSAQADPESLRGVRATGHPMGAAHRRKARSAHLFLPLVDDRPPRIPEAKEKDVISLIGAR